jgi:uncharacterized membrane protein YhfC
VNVKILSLTYFINGFLMIAMPICLTIYLTHKFKRGWRLFWIGAVTFIFSQILHIPFNALIYPAFSKTEFINLPLVLQNVILSIFLGLSAGVFKELSRYAMYRWWAKDARSWITGLLAGAGHGGIEAIILGILVLFGYFQMFVARGVDIATLVAPDKVELAKAQIQAYWSAPWYTSLLGALERLFTIPLHLACSLLVLQSFTRKKFWWMGLAIFFHALADGVAVYFSRIGLSVLGIEAIIGTFAVLSLILIMKLRHPESSEEPVLASVLIPEFKPKLVDETIENLDRTRFQ